MWNGGEGKVGERLSGADPQVSRTKFIVGPLCAGNGCVYSGFCSWRALETKEKTCATETGRAWLDAGGPSLEQREAGGWGGGENSSSQQSICMPQARNFHTATFSGQGHPQSSQDRQQEASRRQETQPWHGTDSGGCLFSPPPPFYRMCSVLILLATVVHQIKLCCVAGVSKGSSFENAQTEVSEPAVWGIFQ